MLDFIFKHTAFLKGKLLMFYCLSHTGSNRYKYIFSTSEYYVFEDRVCEKCGRNIKIPHVVNFPPQFYAEGENSFYLKRK